jgi:hypothetical protein
MHFQRLVLVRPGLDRVVKAKLIIIYPVYCMPPLGRRGILIKNRNKYFLNFSFIFIFNTFHLDAGKSMHMINKEKVLIKTHLKQFSKIKTKPV